MNRNENLRHLLFDVLHVVLDGRREWLAQMRMLLGTMLSIQHVLSMAAATGLTLETRLDLDMIHR
jgi:hypothetical protein